MKDVDTQGMAAEPVRDGGKMFCHKGAEHKDKEIMEHDIIETEGKSIFQPRAGVLRHRPKVAGIEVEDHVGSQKQCKRQPGHAVHQTEQRTPQRHQHVEPKQNDEKINMIHGKTVPQCPNQRGWLKDAEVMADAGHKGHVKKRPDQIRNKNGTGTAAQIVFIVKRLR